MNQPKDYREMATDCSDHAARTDRHDEAMEWIGLGVINALLAVVERLDALASSTPDVRHFAPYGSTNARCGETVPRGVAWMPKQGEYANQRFTVERDRTTCRECLWRMTPDALDEDDHRDRVDRHGDIWQRVHEGCWMELGFPPVSHGPAECLQLAALPGPLAFAPDAEEAPQDATGATESDEQPEQAPEAADAAGAILCPECGHDFDQLPSQVTRLLWLALQGKRSR